MSSCSNKGDDASSARNVPTATTADDAVSTYASRKRPYEDSTISATLMDSKAAAEESLQAAASGIRHIVGRAFSRGTFSLPSQQEAEYHLACAQFCDSLDESQLDMYASFMSRLVTLASHNDGDHNNNKNNVNNNVNSTDTNTTRPEQQQHQLLLLLLPQPLFQCTHQLTSVEEIEECYLKGEHSICQNMPDAN